MGESKASSQPAYLDDRQRPLEFAPEFVIVEQTGVGPSVLSRVVVWLCMAAGMGWVVFSFLGRVRPPTVGDFVPAAIGLVIGQVISWRMKQTRPVLPARAALLAAHRVCGACGYGLHQISVEADGCVVCPECGGAWHQDRFIRADEDPKESELLSSLMSGEIYMGTGERQDDRGQPLRAALKWPPEWLQYSSTPVRAAEALQEAARAKVGRLFRWLAPCALVIWIGLTTVLVARAYEPDFGTAVFTGSVVLLITGIASYAGMRIYIDRAMRRAAVDVVGLCNQCGNALPTDAPRTFDGCVVCRGCKSAWKRGDARELPVVVKSSVVT